MRWVDHPVTSSNEAVDRASLPELIASRVVARLIDEQNELTHDPELTSEVARRIDLVARVVLALRDGGRGIPAVELRSAEVGQRRAASDVHPAASLRVATILFEELYPALLGSGPTVRRDRAVADAIAVQDVLGRIVVDAATGYVDQLLMRLSAVHMEERRALAGYLHDHTAQALASALQRLDYDQVPVSELKAILTAALDEVRGMAFNLRQFVGDRRLDEALGAYIAELIEPDVTIELGQFGVPRHFSQMDQEATFLILREALLNSVKHARAARIEVRLGWRDNVLIAVVKDDGVGFEVGLQGSTRMGLLVCRERAESMSAMLEVRSAPGAGTSVELQVPL